MPDAQGHIFRIGVKFTSIHKHVCIQHAQGGGENTWRKTDGSAMSTCIKIQKDITAEIITVTVAGVLVTV